MTPEKCAASCADFEYFGMEYGVECYCGDRIAAVATTEPEGECNVPCQGDSSKMCGGGWHLSIYEKDRLTVGAFKYQGCYSDSVTNRALKAGYLAGPDMTYEVCAAHCTGHGYFGVEYGAECFCGDVLEGGSTEQTSGCDMTCSGDTAEICGGSAHMSLFATDTATPATTVMNPTISNYTYAGCWTDSVATRVLTGNSKADDLMTVEMCAQHCTGFGIFGVEYGKECYCGDTLGEGSTLATETDCSFLCPGNPGEYCGAGNRLSLWTLTS